MMHSSVTVADCMLACGAGFLLGAYYEVFRLWRLWTHPGVGRVFVQDTLFCTTSAVAFFLFLLAVSDGRPRLWLTAGALIGFFAWRATAGRIIFAVVRRSLRTLRRIGRRWSARRDRLEEKIQFFLAKPVLLLKKGLHKAGRMLYNQHKSRNFSDPEANQEGGAQDAGHQRYRR